MLAAEKILIPVVPVRHQNKRKSRKGLFLFSNEVR
jgi:hypothetical protein